MFRVKQKEAPERQKRGPSFLPKSCGGRRVAEGASGGRSQVGGEVQADAGRAAFVRGGAQRLRPLHHACQPLLLQAACRVTVGLGGGGGAALGGGRTACSERIADMFEGPGENGTGGLGQAERAGLGHRLARGERQPLEGE